MAHVKTVLLALLITLINRSVWMVFVETLGGVRKRFIGTAFTDRVRWEGVKGYQHGYTFNNVRLMFPWFNSLMDRAGEVLGQDWWPYGIDANRKTIEAILRYHYEQGITSKRFTI